MRSYKGTFIILLGLSYCHSILANSSLYINILADIEPRSCSLTISGNGIFDYGNISIASLAKDDMTVLTEKSANLYITCPAEAKIALSMIDNNSSAKRSPIGKTVLGVEVTSSTPTMSLGIDSDNQAIGSYLLSLSSVSIDGVGSNLNTLVSSNNGASWYSSTNNLLNPLSWISWANNNASTPSAFKQLNGVLKVQATLSPTKKLNLGKPVSLSGSSTIFINYL